MIFGSKRVPCFSPKTCQDVFRTRVRKYWIRHKTSKIFVINIKKLKLFRYFSGLGYFVLRPQYICHVWRHLIIPISLKHFSAELNMVMIDCSHASLKMLSVRLRRDSNLVENLNKSFNTCREGSHVQTNQWLSGYFLTLYCFLLVASK